MRMLEMDKKFAKMEGDMEQKEIKEKLNKQKEKWKSLVQELNEVEEKIKNSRSQMDQMHHKSMERLMEMGKKNIEAIGNTSEQRGIGNATEMGLIRRTGK
eukprot:TRINITY_DN16206_c0_g1_i1.p1 TRINITY_DN16206_c0_g1~~TRINITY_DN16206_c0_g1_i1.p1  ORF type:complete len:100 (-),score=32.91 TRINITY_DN16206_c0_g1_i1:158-457(-)